ncbi:hypothetical protein FACS189472_07750 [Alphaproteobacteria bacterium]|nr:hypothetical protein FACS189472_07750 [Alphaproteobacteria bacterium]
MSLSTLAPSLELKLQKQKSTQLENTSTNTNSIIVSNYLDGDRSPRPGATLQSTWSPRTISPIRAIECGQSRSPVKSPVKSATEMPITSPSACIIEKFKDLLIEYQTELLLNDYELICNIVDRGKNIVMREQHLINIIKCLEPEVNEVEIDKEPVTVNCRKCSCTNPLYYKITGVILNRTRDFTTSNFKVILQKQYNISLDFCI